MIFGYFDFIILGILIFLNIKFWRKQFIHGIGWLLGGLLFTFILPFISMLIELMIVKYNGSGVDGIETLYTYLRFPIYWLIGIIQLVISGIKISSIVDNSE